MMKTNKQTIETPRFELHSVFDDGTEAPAQIVPVNKPVWMDAGMTRRGFIGAGMTAATVLALLPKGGAMAAATNRMERTESADVPAAVDCGDGMAHRREVWSLAVSPDGKMLASGSDDWTIKLWGLPDGALLKTLEENKSRVISVTISPDGV